MAVTTGGLRFGPNNGRMLLHTSRKGVGSTVAHDLTIEVTDWSVELDVPETGPVDVTATARVELGSLAVREGTGGARPLTDRDRGEIENNARRTLDVGRHPTATFESSRVVTGDDHATISGTLTLHGVDAPIDVEVRQVTPDRYRADTVVTQSAYGIEPYSALLGALKVRDDVKVEIEVDLGRCPGPDPASEVERPQVGGQLREPLPRVRHQPPG